MLKRVLSAMILLLFAAAAGECAVYGRIDWLQRVKPSIKPGRVGLLGDLIAAESESNTLVFVNAADGTRAWEFAMPATSTLYGTPGQEILAVSGAWALMLDPYGRNVLWIHRLSGGEPRAVFHTPEGRTIIEYDEKSREIVGTKTGKPDAKPPKFSAKWPAVDIFAAAGEPPMGFSWKGGALAGALADGTNWMFTGGADGLVETVVRWKGRALALDKTGRVFMLDPATGAETGGVGLRELIDMRFWDELPAFLNDYSEARLMVNGENLFLALHSAVVKLRLTSFPENLSLKEKKEDTDKWALEKAIGLWEEKEFEQSVVRFRQAADLWPKSTPIRLFLGMAYAAIGQTDSAIAELETAHALDPQDQDVTSNLAGNYVNKIFSLNPAEDQAEIEKTYLKVLALAPSSRLLSIGFAEFLLSANRYADAEEALLASMKYGFHGADAWELLLAAQYMLRNDEAATATAMSALGLFPRAKNVHSLLGKMHCRRGAYAECVKEMKMELAAAGENEKSLLPAIVGGGTEFYLANAKGLTGSYAEGVKMLEKFVASLTAPAAGDTMEAKRRAMVREAERGYLAPALFAMANFQYRLGNKEGSLKALKRIEDMKDDDAEIKSFLGYFYAMNGTNLERALDLAFDAIKESPKNPMFLKNYAVALWKLKRYQEAERNFQRAAEIDEDAEFIHFDYGSMLIEMGRKKEGIERIEREVKLNPELEAPRALLRKLKGKR